MTSGVRTGLQKKFVKKVRSPLLGSGARANEDERLLQQTRTRSKQTKGLVLQYRLKTVNPIKERSDAETQSRRDPELKTGRQEQTSQKDKCTEEDDDPCPASRSHRMAKPRLYRPLSAGREEDCSKTDDVDKLHTESLSESSSHEQGDDLSAPGDHVTISPKNDKRNLSRVNETDKSHGSQSPKSIRNEGTLGEKEPKANNSEAEEQSYSSEKKRPEKSEAERDLSKFVDRKSERGRKQTRSKERWEQKQSGEQNKSENVWRSLASEMKARKEEQEQQDSVSEKNSRKTENPRQHSRAHKERGDSGYLFTTARRHGKANTVSLMSEQKRSKSEIVPLKSEKERQHKRSEMNAEMPRHVSQRSRSEKHSRPEHEKSERGPQKIEQHSHASRLLHRKSQQEEHSKAERVLRNSNHDRRQSRERSQRSDLERRHKAEKVCRKSEPKQSTAGRVSRKSDPERRRSGSAEDQKSEQKRYHSRSDKKQRKGDHQWHGGASGHRNSEWSGLRSRKRYEHDRESTRRSKHEDQKGSVTKGKSQETKTRHQSRNHEHVSNRESSEQRHTRMKSPAKKDQSKNVERTSTYEDRRSGKENKDAKEQARSKSKAQSRKKVPKNLVPVFPWESRCPTAYMVYSKEVRKSKRLRSSKRKTTHRHKDKHHHRTNAGKEMKRRLTMTPIKNLMALAYPSSNRDTEHRHNSIYFSQGPPGYPYPESWTKLHTCGWRPPARSLAGLPWFPGVQCGRFSLNYPRRAGGEARTGSRPDTVNTHWDETKWMYDHMKQHTITQKVHVGRTAAEEKPRLRGGQDVPSIHKKETRVVEAKSGDKNRLRGSVEKRKSGYKTEKASKPGKKVETKTGEKPKEPASKPKTTGKKEKRNLQKNEAGLEEGEPQTQKSKYQNQERPKDREKSQPPNHTPKPFASETSEKHWGGKDKPDQEHWIQRSDHEQTFYYPKNNWTANRLLDSTQTFVYERDGRAAGGKDLLGEIHQRNEIIGQHSHLHNEQSIYADLPMYEAPHSYEGECRYEYPLMYENQNYDGQPIYKIPEDYEGSQYQEYPMTYDVPPQKYDIWVPKSMSVKSSSHVLPTTKEGTCVASYNLKALRECPFGPTFYTMSIKRNNGGNLTGCVEQGSLCSVKTLYEYLGHKKSESEPLADCSGRIYRSKEALFNKTTEKAKSSSAPEGFGLSLSMTLKDITDIPYSKSSGAKERKRGSQQDSLLSLYEKSRIIRDLVSREITDLNAENISATSELLQAYNPTGVIYRAMSHPETARKNGDKNMSRDDSPGTKSVTKEKASQKRKQNRASKERKHEVGEKLNGIKDRSHTLTSRRGVKQQKKQQKPRQSSGVGKQTTTSIQSTTREYPQRKISRQTHKIKPPYLRKERKRSYNRYRELSQKPIAVPFAVHTDNQKRKSSASKSEAYPDRWRRKTIPADKSPFNRSNRRSLRNSSARQYAYSNGSSMKQLGASKCRRIDKPFRPPGNGQKVSSGRQEKAFLGGGGGIPSPGGIERVRSTRPSRDRGTSSPKSIPRPRSPLSGGNRTFRSKHTEAERPSFRKRVPSNGRVKIAGGDQVRTAPAQRSHRTQEPARYKTRFHGHRPPESLTYDTESSTYTQSSSGTYTEDQSKLSEDVEEPHGILRHRSAVSRSVSDTCSIHIPSKNVRFSPRQADPHFKKQFLGRATSGRDYRSYTTRRNRSTPKLCKKRLRWMNSSTTDDKDLRSASTTTTNSTTTRSSYNNSTGSVYSMMYEFEERIEVTNGRKGRMLPANRYDGGIAPLSKVGSLRDLRKEFHKCLTSNVSSATLEEVPESSNSLRNESCSSIVVSINPPSKKREPRTSLKRERKKANDKKRLRAPVPTETIKITNCELQGRMAQVERNHQKLMQMTSVLSFANTQTQPTPTITMSPLPKARRSGGSHTHRFPDIDTPLRTKYQTSPFSESLVHVTKGGNTARSNPTATPRKSEIKPKKSTRTKKPVVKKKGSNPTASPRKNTSKKSTGEKKRAK